MECLISFTSILQNEGIVFNSTEEYCFFKMQTSHILKTLTFFIKTGKKCTSLFLFQYSEHTFPVQAWT